VRIMRPVGALAVLALVLSACVAAPGASTDPSASASPSASPDASASPATKKVVCPTPLPLDPATGAMVTTIQALSALGDDAAPCYGTAKLQVTGYVPILVGLGGTDVYTYAPSWLYGNYAGALLAIGRGYDAMQSASLQVYPTPEMGACPSTQDEAGCALNPYLQKWVTVVGHYNDPASSTCVATGVDASVPPRPASESELTCLRHFVLDSLAPFADTGPLPPVDAGLCPVDPITVDQLVGGTASVGQQYGLGCLGAKEISFQVYVVPGVGLLSGMEQYTVAPRWLADPLNTGIVFAADASAAADAANWFVGRVPPDMIAPGESYPGFADVACDGSAVDPKSCPFAPYVGQMGTVTGHYDDPESLTCAVVGGPGGTSPGGATPITPEAVVQGCREQFVVDRFVPSGAPTSTPGPTSTPPTTSTR
jgi:hypothetical protein